MSSVANPADFTVSILTLPEIEPKPLITLGKSNRPVVSWLIGDQALIVSGRLNGRDGFWRVPLDGSTAPLQLDQRGFVEARVSPDGEHLTFTVADPNPGKIWIYEPGR